MGGCPSYEDILAFGQPSVLDSPESDKKILVKTVEDMTKYP